MTSLTSFPSATKLQPGIRSAHLSCFTRHLLGLIEADGRSVDLSRGDIVSRVCQDLGISRTLFYRWRRRLERYGTDGLHPRRWQAQPGRPRQLAPPLERLILSVAVSEATWGCGRLAAHLAHRWGVHVAPSTIQRLLRRQGLATRRRRLLVLEH